MRTRATVFTVLVAGAFAGLILADMGTFQWEKTNDVGIGDDYYASVAIDSQGRIVAAGYGNAAVGTDGFIVRYGTDGIVDFADTFDNAATVAAPSASGDSWRGVCVDSDDNMIVTGIVSGWYGNPDNYNQTMITRKYLADGTFAWERVEDFYGWAGGYAVATDDDDNVYVGGHAFFDWGATQGAWVIMKYDKDGTLQSGFPIVYNYLANSVAQDICYGLTVDGDGNIIAVGVRGVSGVAGGATNNLDLHVRKYDSAGTLLWDDTFDGGANLYDYAEDVTTDADGNVYVSGYTNRGTDNRGNLDWDWVVIKYASDGTREWLRVYDASTRKNEVAYGITIDPSGAVYVTGYVNDDADTTEARSERLDPATGSLIEEWTEAALGGHVPLDIVYRDGRLASAGRVKGASALDAYVTLLSMNRAPVVTAGPTFDPKVPAPGEPVTFQVSAMDDDGDNLTYEWDFGDGGTGTGRNPVHTYAAGGPHTVTVEVDDGKTDTEASCRVPVGMPIDDMKLVGKVNFKKPDKDTFSLKGTPVLPAGFVPDGAQITVDVGGVEKTYTLDAKGKAKTLTGKVKLKFSKKKGTWTLSLKEKNGSFAAAWADEGVVNDTVKDVPLGFKVTIDVGTDACAHLTDRIYKCKEDKAGKFK